MRDEIPPFFEDASAQAEPFETIDAADILSAPYVEPSFLVRYLLPNRSVGLITGDSGAGKSALLFHACVAIAVGLPMAGRFDVDPDAGPILYVNGEMAGPDVHRYLASAAAGLRTSIPRGRLHFEGRDGLRTSSSAKNPKRPLRRRVRPFVPV